MARKFGSRQLKRERAPRSWTIHRKEKTWAPNPRPGAHRRERSLPLVLLLREILGQAANSREAEKILNRSMVKVDGVARKDHRFPVGLMDVVTITGLGKSYRVLPRPGHGLSLFQIDDKESSYKICKIVGKRTLQKGQIQVALHDGRTALVPAKEAQPKGEAVFSVGGALQLSVPAQKVVRQIPFQAGVLGLVIDGRNEGAYGKITTVTEGTSVRPRMAKIETQENAFETLADYVLPVGIETPLVAVAR